MFVIYEPSGKAREYAPLAVSLYRGCPNGCVYCFGPDVLHMKREGFLNVKPRESILTKLEKDCKVLAGTNDQREILASFTCDPYPKIESEIGLTRSMIQMFNKYNLHYTILTKGGVYSTWDFDIMQKRLDLCRYGTTLTCDNDQSQEIWEPKAPSWTDRINALRTAHSLGINTWVSIEPIISPAMSLNLIRQTADFVNTYRIGKMNYQKELPYTDVDLIAFAKEVKKILDEKGREYIFKKSMEFVLKEI